MTSLVRQQFEALAARAEAVLAERGASDQIIVQVGSATCEHAAGSRAVLDEFRKHVAASGRSDIVLRHTGCTGRCSREPIVGVFVPGQMPVKYERVDREPFRAGRRTGTLFRLRRRRKGAIHEVLIADVTLLMLL